MSRHANFAAAIALRQGTLQDLVRILHGANQIGHEMNADTPVPVPTGMGRLQMALFLDAPAIVCSAATPDRLGLVLRGWGPMTVTMPQPGAADLVATREVLFETRVMAQPDFRLAASELTLNVVANTATLTQLNVSVLSGGPWPAPVATWLTSPQFEFLVAIALRVRLTQMTRLAPPVNVSFLGDVAASPSTTARARILDGAIAIGLDVNDAGVTTTGDPALLTNFLGGDDIALWTNPSAAPVAFAMLRRSVQQAVDQQGATLDTFTLALQPGQLHVEGAASKDLGRVTFSLNAVPHLVRPGWTETWEEEYGDRFTIEHPPREELWFELKDRVVNMEPAWWVRLLEVLSGVGTAGVAVAIVEAMVDMVRGNVLGGVGTNRRIAPRVQEFRLPNVREPRVLLRIQRFEFHAEGAFTSMRLRPQWPAALVQGPGDMEAETLATQPARYSLRLPPGALEADPNLRVRWTLRRLDTNQGILDSDGVASAGTSFAAYLNDPSLLTCSRFAISCRVYRTLGTQVTDLHNETVTLRIHDVLDRTHPYVRWSHTVVAPDVHVERNGARTQRGFKHVARQSALHRTAVPGRCKMVTNFSRKMAPNSPTRGLEYLDALPFPTADLVARRAEVCDYCFFGGPEKSDPLIPI